MARPWLRAKRFIVHNILHADDTPHSLALSVAMAVFIGILPLVGIQMFLAVTLATLFRVNKVVCVPVVWISNPLTMVPLYGGCLALGRFLVGSNNESGVRDLLDALTNHNTAHSWFNIDFWSQLFSTLASLGAELWLGCVVIGLPAAILSYPTVKWLVISHREKSRRRQLRRQLYRTQISSQRTGN